MIATGIAKGRNRQLSQNICPCLPDTLKQRKQHDESSSHLGAVLDDFTSITGLQSLSVDATSIFREEQIEAVVARFGQMFVVRYTNHRAFDAEDKFASVNRLGCEKTSAFPWHLLSIDRSGKVLRHRGMPG